MNILIRAISFVLFISSCSISLQAMECQSSSSLVSSGRSTKIVKAIDKAKEGGEVMLESPFFSDQKIVEALCRAAKRGVKTEVHVASRAKANLKKLEDAGVKVKIIPGLHAKRVLVVPDKDQPEKNKVFIGSDNMSFCSQFHKENMVKTKNDENYFEQNRSLFNSPKPSKKRKHVKITPEGRNILASANYRLNSAKKRRIAKVFEQQGPNNSLDIASMTFDDEPIVQAIEEGYEKCTEENRPTIRCLFDSSASAHPDLLDRIKKAGKDAASIYIFNKEKSDKAFNKISKLQHTKTITRACNGEKFSAVSTGNLAKRSDIDFNIDSYHPGDEELFERIREHNDSIIAESTEYTGS